MTFQQLEYIIAVDTYRHFATAAAHCFVTQPTLSMQLMKLEEELGITLFDRSRQPVVPTEAGIDVIAQARHLIAARDRLKDEIAMKKGSVSGELRIGIIPTLAPYLLPLFIQSFTRKYPSVHLIVHEQITESIIAGLRAGSLDAGILVSPLHEDGIRESVLFYEEMLAYVSRANSAWSKTYVLPQDIDPQKLWLLEEGHCFRSQIMNLCELQKISKQKNRFDYEAGSIETLRRMVETTDGITIIPELATLDMPKRQQSLVRPFRKPAPTREVSLVVHRDFIKLKLIEAIREEIIASLPSRIRQNKPSRIVPLDGA